MATAGNATTPAQNLERLSQDAVNYVRWSVAHNEKTPANALETLVKDPDSYVSDEAKKNPNAPRSGFWSRLFRK